MPLDPQAKQLIEQSATAGLPPNSALTPPEARRAMEQRAAGIVWGPQHLAAVEDLEIVGPGGELHLRVYTPEGNGPFPLLLYFHGGGWVVGSVATHDNVCRQLSLESGCVLVSVDYRLAPENKFPAAVHDGYAALLWAFAHATELNADPARIEVGGDSSGGNLATVTCLKAKAEGGPMPAFQLLFYPVTNHSFDTDSYSENAQGYMLSQDDMRWYWNHYLHSEKDSKNPLASPLQAPDLRGLPPALVISAEFDPLRDEAEAYAARLRAADVSTTLIRYDGMIHGFLRWAPVLDKARKAITQAAQELKSVIAYK
jgi:acetyl esterase